MSVSQLLKSAGAIGYILAGLLIAATVVFLMRVFHLWREQNQLKVVKSSNETLAKQISNASDANADESSFFHVLSAAASVTKYGRATEYRVLLHKLETIYEPSLLRLTWVLSTIAVIAPMLGLFGTVIGMSEAFAEIANGQAVQQQELARTISFALSTTVIGLFVAMPVLAANQAVNAWAASIVNGVEQVLNRFLEERHVQGTTSGDAGTKSGER